MRRSQLFTGTRKDAPADETSRNAQLLIRGGFVHKELAGVYTYLPMGLRVLENISNVVRDEMNDIGGQELRMTILQEPSLWQKTGRWDDKTVDVWFKTKLNAGGELGLGMTHEEPLTNLLTNYVNSYKDLPFLAYQIQTKLRNELRAKSGIMRGREFLMKDLYSFSRNAQEHDEQYEKIKQAYFKVFDRLGIGDKTFLTFASGGMFSKYSHEFQTLSDAGEDTIYLDRAKKLAVNEEVLDDEVLADLDLKKDQLEAVSAAEVGNIFSLGTKFSEPLGLHFTNEEGSQEPVLMGCYGIGVSRIMGVLAELLSDDKGLVWPLHIAPFHVYLAKLGTDEATTKEADRVYKQLTESGITVIYDDRDARAGEMFADADLVGIPYRVVVSQRTLQEGRYELKSRTAADPELVTFDSLLQTLAQAIKG